MHYEIEYFHPTIEADIETWPASIKADYRRISLLVMEYGPQVRMPHTKAMGGGLLKRPKKRRKKSFGLPEKECRRYNNGRLTISAGTL